MFHLKILFKLKQMNSDRDINLTVMWSLTARYQNSLQKKKWIIDDRQLYYRSKKFHFYLQQCLNESSPLNKGIGGHDFHKHHTVFTELFLW